MPELLDIDPRTLLIDVNVRGDARPDSELVDSIRDVGVLQPVTAVRTRDGQYRVRYGHRRTLAAIEADKVTVPVIVAGDEDDDQAERIVRQLDENERRKQLDQSDRVQAVRQLALLGVTTDQIARRTRTKPAIVDAAVKVGQSEWATKAVDQYPFLDLEQAAIVVDYADDPDTVETLVRAAERGHFAHAAQTARDKREERLTFLATAKPYEDRGVKVVSSMYGAGGQNPAMLDRLRAANGDEITEEQHEQCPGHAVLLELCDDWFAPDEVPEGWTIVPTDDDEDDDTGEVYAQCLVPGALCLDWREHGHRLARDESRPSPHGVGPAAPVDQAAEEVRKQAETEERRRVIRLNKEWKSAEVVRRNFLTQLLTRKTPPKGSSVFVAGMIARRVYEFRYALDHGHRLAVELFGLAAGEGHAWRADIEALTKALDRASEPRAQVITLGLILASIEGRTDTHTWRKVDPTVAAYFTFLVEQGYTLSEVEAIAVGQDSLPTAEG